MLDFYKGKRVFITGHTGFKGAWLCKVLANAGANIIGYSLKPEENSLFEIAEIKKDVKSVFGDIRNFENLKNAFDGAKPEIVIHMAAQPIVRESYKNPRYTYETNIMGTINLLECIRLSNCVKSFLNVTTDKVYENKELDRGYTEDDNLKGYDPYSNSKSCSELVTYCYQKSFLSEKEIAVSTARAGNVIGGGDFAIYRIIPDCIRAALSGNNIEVRNPNSIRPYQHVLEPLNAYLMIIENQYKDIKYADCYNVGSDIKDCITTGQLAELFCKYWGNGLKWVDKSDKGPHETKTLLLDCSKMKNTFGWKPYWDINKAIEKVVEWTKCFSSKGDIRTCMDKQIEEFLSHK
jgi:CDP-glucose 4,6-dehydratase